MAEDQRDRLRSVEERLADEQRKWSGDEEVSKRRAIEERYNDARGHRSDLAWGAGGIDREDRTDEVTSVPSDDEGREADRNADQPQEDRKSKERSS